MKTMSEYAFYKCDKIEHVNLGYSQIDLVSEHAFDLNNKSDNKFNLYLYCNYLTENSFSIDSLMHFKRPAQLNFKRNKTKYWKFEIFKPFLDAHQQNKMSIYYVADDRNEWIKRMNDQKYERSFIY